MKKKTILHILVLTVFSLLGFSCGETLPPFRDPLDVFDAQHEALYVISGSDNSLKAFVYLINVFDETFDGRAAIDGTVTIEWASNPSFRKTYRVTPNNILSGKYTPGTNTLTIDSRDTLKFIFSWNFIDDNGRDIRDMATYHTDPSCQQRRISDPLTFTIRSEVKVFEKINFVSAPAISPVIIHHRQFFPGNFCTPLKVAPE